VPARILIIFVDRLLAIATLQHRPNRRRTLRQRRRRLQTSWIPVAQMQYRAAVTGALQHLLERSVCRSWHPGGRSRAPASFVRIVRPFTTSPNRDVPPQA